MLVMLWLLLPVAAGAGWLAGRRAESARPEAFWEHTRNFHQGLSELFNDRAAVDEDAEDLLDGLAGRNVDPDSGRPIVDRDTAETHIALGNLFRRRGDTERAILLHESLLAHGELPDGVRADARYELARDYESAGLLDRSQAVFRVLIERGERVDEAYLALLELHESEHDWAQAGTVAHEWLARIAAGPPGGDASADALTRITPARLAHYRCEQADEASRNGDRDAADALLDRALEHDPDHGRAHLMRARRALERQRPGEALAHFEAVEAARPDLLPDFIEQRFAAFAAQDDKAALEAYLEGLRKRRNAYTVIKHAREVIEAREGTTAANRFFKDQIVRRPSLRALRDWARDQVDSPRTKEPEKVAIVVAMLDRVVEDKPAYLCAHCGFRGNVLHWRCPSCGQWDTVSTIIGVEGE